MLTRKQVIRPGRYFLRDGRVFECRPEEVSHYARRMDEMAKAGLHIPVVWEHQSNAKPLTMSDWDDWRARFARSCIGHVHGAEDGGEATFDAIDPDDRKALAKAKFVSPEIAWDYVDPTGREWPGPSILHVAVTPVPIQVDQAPFESSYAKGGDGATLSLSSWRARPSMFQSQSPIRLSESRFEPFGGKKKMANKPDDDDGDEEVPGGDEMGENVTDQGLEEPSDDNAPAPAPPAPVTAPPPPPPAPDPGMGLGNDRKLKEALHCLSEEGLVLGDDTTMDNLVDRLVVACHTKEAVHSGLEEENQEEPPAEQPPGSQSNESDMGAGSQAPPPAPPNQTSPSPIMMSQQMNPQQLQAHVVALEKKAKAYDALVKEHEKLKVSLSSITTAKDRAEKKLEEQRRQKLKDDIAEIGKIFPSVVGDLERKAQTCTLQLSSNGNYLDNPVLAEIRTYKQACKAAPFAQVQLSHLNGVTISSPPDTISNEPSNQALGAGKEEATAKEIGREMGEMYVGKKKTA